MPTFVSAGSADFRSTGTFSPGLPAGWAADDVHVLVAQRADTTAVTPLTGWTQVAGASGSVGAGLRVEVWWRRAVAGDAPPVVTMGAGATTVRGGRIYGVRGCPTAGSPFDTGAGAPTFSANTTADLTVEFTELTTTVAGCLALALACYEDDFDTATTMSGWTQPANAISVTTQLTDMGIVYQHRTLAGTGATGVGTVTVAGAGTGASVSAGVLLAFVPPAGGAAAAQRWTGSAWTAAAVQRWDGSAWVPATVKRWDGTGWV